MQFRAVGLDSESYDFTVADCPVVLSAGVIALAAQPKSKLLWEDTIVRGSDNGIYEGDRIFSRSRYLGYVVYIKGFRLRYEDSGRIRDVPYGKNITILKGLKGSMRKAASDPDRTRLTLKVKNDQFEFNGILCGCKDNKIAIATGKCQDSYADLRDIRHSTGIEKEGVTLFFGDEFMGGTVALKNGIPVVLKPDGSMLRLTK